MTMEVTLYAALLGIFYQFLGLDGFRIGNVHHDPYINQLQMDNSRAPSWNGLLSKTGEVMSSYDRKKRFFEFNPVAFTEEPLNIPVDEERRKMSYLSPSLISIERLKTNSKEEYPVQKFKSSYITDGERPKHLKPFLDHFSGVKSFVLHLKNPDRPDSFDETTEVGTFPEVDQPVYGISMRAFRKPNRNLLTKGDSRNVERNTHAPHTSWSDKYESKNPFQTFDDNSLDFNTQAHTGNKQYPLDFSTIENLYQEDVNSVQEPHDSIDNDGSVHSENFKYMNGPSLDKFDQFKDSAAHTKKTYPQPNFYDVLDPTDRFQVFDKSHEFEPNELGALETGSLEYGQTPVAHDFGSFGELIEKIEKSQSTEGFGHLKGTETKPYLDSDEMLPDDFQSFEQGFGSFSSGDSNCDNIDTKACLEHSDCSCFGLYQCNKGKCILTAELQPGFPSGQTEVGQWHEEPVQYNSWKK